MAVDEPTAHSYASPLPMVPSRHAISASPHHAFTPNASDGRPSHVRVSHTCHSYVFLLSTPLACEVGCALGIYRHEPADGNAEAEGRVLSASMS